MYRWTCAGLCWLVASQALALADTTVFVPPDASKQTLQIADAPNPGGDAVTINLLAVYTDRFEAQLNGHGYGMADYLLRTYAEVNRYFANTGLRTRVRLAGLQRWALAPGGAIVQDNEALVRYVEGAGGHRDAFAADLVQLWEVTEPDIDDPQICGWGQTMGPQRLISTAGYGYSTIARGQVDTEYSGCYADAAPERIALLAAHEIGHNLGSTHAWHEDSGEGAFTFSHGQLCGDAYAGYPQGTIMSTSGFRLPYFSTPARHLDGQPCGVPDGQPYAADNAETFTRTAGAIAALRRRLPGAGAASAEMPARIGELNGSLPIVLTRSDATGAASLELLVIGESARAGADFVSPYSRRVSFAPGEWQVTVLVELNADGRREPDESLVVWLQRPEGLRLAGGRGFRVEIVDNVMLLLGDLLGDVLGNATRAAALPGSEVPDADPRSLSVASTAGGAASGPAPGAAGSGGVLLLLLAAIRRRGARTPGRGTSAWDAHKYLTLRPIRYAS